MWPFKKDSYEDLLNRYTKPLITISAGSTILWVEGKRVRNSREASWMIVHADRRVQRRIEEIEKAEKFQTAENKFAHTLDYKCTVEVIKGRYGACLSIPEWDPDEDILIAGIENIHCTWIGGVKLEKVLGSILENWRPASIKISMASGREFYFRCHPKIADLLLFNLRKAWREHR